MEAVTLETEHLVLRAFALADIDAMYEACLDEGIQFYTPVPVPFRRADAGERIGEKQPARSPARPPWQVAEPSVSGPLVAGGRGVDLDVVAGFAHRHPRQRGQWTQRLGVGEGLAGQGEGGAVAGAGEDVAGR